MKKYLIYTTKGQCTNVYFNANSEKEAIKLANNHFKDGVLSFTQGYKVKDKYWAKEVDETQYPYKTIN